MKKLLVLPAFLSLALISGPASFANAKSADETKSSAEDTKKSPSLSAATVRSVVKANMLEVQKCYTDLLIEGMATTGKVVVTWNIDGEGKAQDIATKDLKPEDQALSGCVTEKVASWAFPASQAEKDYPVTYTFNFGS